MYKLTGKTVTGQRFQVMLSDLTREASTPLRYLHKRGIDARYVNVWYAEGWSWLVKRPFSLIAKHIK